jgi:hypothetical protein
LYKKLNGRPLRGQSTATNCPLPDNVI